MKKSQLFFVVILMFFFLTIGSSCDGGYSKSTDPQEYLSFELLDDDTYAVVGFLGRYVQHLVIPATHNELAVSTIKMSAFKMNRGIWGRKINLPIETLVIEEGVVTIEEEAFYDSGLIHVTLANSIESIGYEAFAYNDCTINIPSSIKYIGDWAFARTRLSGDLVLDNIELKEGAFYGTEVSSVTFSNDRETIPELLFNNCLLLTNVTFPNQLLEIGANAFSDCALLTQISLPRTLAFIRRQAFENTGLSSVAFLSGLQTIESSAFANCKKLASVQFSDQNITIETDAFLNCSMLNDVFFGKNVLVVPQAFKGCPLNSMSLSSEGIYDMIDGNIVLNDNGNIKLVLSKEGISDFSSFHKIGSYSCFGRTFDQLVIGDQVALIEAYAFSWAVIHEALISALVVGTNAFDYSTIDSITISSKQIQKQAFYQVENLQEIIFSEGCETIEEVAVSVCFDLERVYFPSTLKEVGIGAFIQCHKLTEVYYDLETGPLVLLSSANFIIYQSNILNEQNKIDVKIKDGFTIYVYEEIYEEALSKWSYLPQSHKYVFHNTLEGCIQIRK